MQEVLDKKLHKCLEHSATKMENRSGHTIKAVMFNNAKELVAGRMKEYYEHKETQNNWYHTHLC